MLKNKKIMKCFSSVVLLLAAVIIGNGQSCPSLAAGCLDETFGVGGKTIVQPPLADNDASTGHRGSVRQSDNKIVSLANANDPGNTFRNVIVRFNADGSLDNAFGSGGYAYVNWSSAGGVANSIAIQQVAGEERFVIAGSSACGRNSCLRAERYTSTGSLDTTFGTGGVTSIVATYPNAIAVQSADQKILMVGSDGILVRLNSNGTPDAAFGKNGISPTGSGVNVRALAFQSTGKIIVAGWVGQSKTDMAVARFNGNGTLDDGSRADSTPADFFGVAGKATADFAGKSEWGYDVAVDGSDRIVVAGQTQITGTTTQDGDAALVRFTSAGKLDTTFGTGGKTSLNINGLQDLFYSIAFQANGKIIVLGDSLIYSGNRDFSVVRYTCEGILDTSFGTNGWVTTDIYGEVEYGEKGFIQTDPNCNCQKIVMVGTASTGGANSPRYIAALRYIL